MSSYDNRLLGLRIEIHGHCTRYDTRQLLLFHPPRAAHQQGRQALPVADVPTGYDSLVSASSPPCTVWLM